MRWVTGITLSKHKCVLGFCVLQDCALDIKESLQRNSSELSMKDMAVYMHRGWNWWCVEPEFLMNVQDRGVRWRWWPSCLSRKLRDEGQRSPNSLTRGCGHFLKKKINKLNYWLKYVYKYRWYQIRDQTTFLGWVQRNSPTVQEFTYSCSDAPSSVERPRKVTLRELPFTLHFYVKKVVLGSWNSVSHSSLGSASLARPIVSVHVLLLNTPNGMPAAFF